MNEVIMSSKAGATDSNVIPIKVTTAVDGVPSKPLMSMLTLPPDPGAAGGVGGVGGVGSIGEAWPTAVPAHIKTAVSRRAHSATNHTRYSREEGSPGKPEPAERINCGVP
ncbi:hypothetical protein Pure05_36700 [Paenarthrobacter ureafaciens]|nr:hypothetical protein NicSoilE8_08380 [Arthrobacter sp. NicSoilE8]GLU61159.1 hypothetical protein Pure01_36720 [Paenarthrobacter ureafaciens]GLU65428.1 hypothetical protein Pure02_36780 [Paenarthrobacter ureafaciens]GLU69815.1 hypothetical protein Pure03_37910 [Paenarthrobacter ureafaciens]GLU74043.1 hypothetical protein Pure04_37580 [Paenarthrobacter ureafaciens]